MVTPLTYVANILDYICSLLRKKNFSKDKNRLREFAFRFSCEDKFQYDKKYNLSLYKYLNILWYFPMYHVFSICLIPTEWHLRICKCHNIKDSCNLLTSFLIKIGKWIISYRMQTIIVNILMCLSAKSRQKL